MGRNCVVLGATGLLGHEVVMSFALAGWRVRGLSRKTCDVTNKQAVVNACNEVDLIINCAAYTDVEGAEIDSSLRPFDVNADGAENVAREAAASRTRLLHISTDYVFDGMVVHRPSLETYDPRPRGAYARSKYVGEQRVISICPKASWIVRTASLYGSGKNFFDTIIQRARAKQPLRVVDDQVTAPTGARELAEQLVALVEADAAPGIYHATADGSTTWYEAARFALDHIGLRGTPITAVSTAEYGGLAPRPAYSILANDKLKALGIHRMRPWRIALAEWLDRNYLSEASASAT